ncbi:MAG: ATP-binding protein [Thaumarchaeota archaeon]|nr:ATP-binding protein [Nitrososphaerota archaeon]MDE1840844.1 ATP-binding protein [Nitrososphaerota archaeon]
MTIGVVIGESRPTDVTAQSSKPLSVGEYVIIDSQDGQILGLVEKSIISSEALTDVRNFDEAVESKEVADINSRDKNYKVKIGILGFLDKLQNGQMVLPAVPPLPGTSILEATQKDLGAIFGPITEEWIRIGSLLRNSSIEAKINVNKMVSRHLAILAMTGMGKSNLVSLIARHVSSLNGTLIIFDYHNDYENLDVPKINYMLAKINPRLLPSDKLAEVIELRENADKQQRALRESLTEAVKQSKDFWQALEESTASFGRTAKGYADSASRVLDKIDDAKHRFSDILDPDCGDPVDLIKEGRVNVLNISELSERQANAGLSYYLQELLQHRKDAVWERKGKTSSKRNNKFLAPIFVIIEEAHVFIPKGEHTDTKYWASKVAREGRKFGIGLGVVSQRPRNIDPNVLSQMGSLAIMKIVQDDDQQQIASAAESLSKDLLSQLSSLNIGDAVLIGQWVNLPSIVHVDEVKSKKSGSDLNAVSEWNQTDKFKQVAKESTESMIQKDLLLD